MKKRTPFCLFFLVTITVGSFCCSCSKSDENAITETETAENTTVVNDEPLLPERDYKGDDFHFLIRDWDAYRETYVYTAELDGEVVNDAVYNRNKKVEEKFNVTLSATYDENATETAQKAIMAGDSNFDVLWSSKTELSRLAAGGYLVDFNQFDYVTLDAPYWDKNASEQLSIAKKLYMMPSDISMNNLSGVRFLYFNKKIIEDYKLPDPYALVTKNEWTLDNFLNMVKQVSSDLNGDGKMDNNDLFGMLTEEAPDNGNIMYLITSAGIRNTTNDENGIPKMSFMGDKIVTIMDKARTVLKDKSCCIDYGTLTKGVDVSQFLHLWEYARSLFASNHFLFVQNGTSVSYQFTNMESDYGIAPNPKYDSAQKEYYHRVDPYSTMMAVPTTNSDLERTGIVLEYMSYVSSKTVLPAYYETTIKLKRSRDDTAAQMLDTIKGSIYYDISDIFSLGISGIVYDGYVKGNLASTYAKKEISLQENIDKLVESFTDK